MAPVAAQFVEDWFGDASCQALADLYEKTNGTEGRVVEVGCWEGRSTIALANACHPEVVHAVDTWQGSPGEISAELASERDVFARFKANVFAETCGNVVPFRMDWRDYFATHDGPIRFLHIDATHSFSEVHDNIAAARPLMALGSILCGDDAHHPPIQQAVLKHFPNAFAMATLWWVQC